MNTPIGGQFVMPDIVVSHFHLREGDLVADFGAGSGFFLKPLSQAVGETGRVFACEIQKVLVEKLGDQARLQGLSNVHPLWCDLEESNGIKIGTNELDVAIMVNTLFMIEDKDTAVAEMGRTVRTGGKFFVIDWTESFAGMGPAPDHVVSAEEATILFEKNGFVFEREYPAGGHHYGLAFRKV
ncbi:methyltransferase domain-containing protein [Candidatus Nomurabacteria bacterium]|nr:methyltransferase domain-containing protein [Candidatus Kaiserbacteria bacterium]MCB9810330.1 methyltransferase domain-containing protein [Candidatus Nomurabacteria bacterium]MCB9818461.1 methyltransferase domain-containing protein [Candidatus Nomurabacteria bacterium]